MKMLYLYTSVHFFLSLLLPFLLAFLCLFACFIPFSLNLCLPLSAVSFTFVVLSMIVRVFFSFSALNYILLFLVLPHPSFGVLWHHKHLLTTASQPKLLSCLDPHRLPGGGAGPAVMVYTIHQRWDFREENCSREFPSWCLWLRPSRGLQCEHQRSNVACPVSGLKERWYNL